MSSRHPNRPQPIKRASASAGSGSSRTPAPAKDQEKRERSSRDGISRKREPRVCVRKACDNCKQSKAKCSGETPICSRCERIGRECTYDSVDERDARRDIKDSIRQQRLENNQYKEILEHMRTASLPHLQRSMTILRDPVGASIEDLLIFIRNDRNTILPARDISPETTTSELTLLQNLQLEKEGQTVPEQIGLGIIDDRPLMNIHLTAEPWTAVIDDGELISHLISSYITWDSVAWNWLDIDIFLESMEERDFTYCSPLLVNAMLALACHLSPRVPVRCDPHNVNTLGYRFIERAIDLWHEASSIPTLPTIISGMILCEVISVNGKDHLGYMLFQTSVSLYHKLVAELAGEEPRDKKWDRAFATTAWGLFRLSTFFTLLNKRAPPMGVPAVELPRGRYTDEDNNDNRQKKRKLPIFSTWRPYPYTQPAEACRLEECIRMCSDVCLIIHDLIVLQTSGKGSELQSITGKEKRQLFERAMEWKRNIPDGLDVGETVAPFAVTPHLGYLQLILELCSAPLDTASMESEEVSLLLEDTNMWYKDAKADLISLLDEYDRKYGLSLAPETILLGPMYASKIIIQEIKTANEVKSRGVSPDTPDSPEKSLGSDETIETLTTNFDKTINWLCSASEQFFTAKLFAKALQLSGESLNVVLSDATKNRLDGLLMMGDESKSKWIDQLYKADSILTLSLGHGADTVVDVIEKLDSLKV